jgi:hypothetical protein
MKPSQPSASLVGTIAAAAGKPWQCHMGQRMPVGTNHAHWLTAGAFRTIHRECACLQGVRLQTSFVLAYE